MYSVCKNFVSLFLFLGTIGQLLAHQMCYKKHTVCACNILINGDGFRWMQVGARLAEKQWKEVLLGAFGWVRPLGYEWHKWKSWHKCTDGNDRYYFGHFSFSIWSNWQLILILQLSLRFTETLSFPRNSIWSKIGQSETQSNSKSICICFKL